LNWQAPDPPGGARLCQIGAARACTGFLPFPVSAHPPRRSPKPQSLRRSVRGTAAHRISAFSTGLTRRRSMAKVGGCANGLRIACGASPLGGRSPHSLGTPIDLKPPKRMRARKTAKTLVPTRWGHLLIGNPMPLIGTRSGRLSFLVPTRWGHLLIGNIDSAINVILANCCGPHSLGKPIDWKPSDLDGLLSHQDTVTTRWLHPLIENYLLLHGIYLPQGTPLKHGERHSPGSHPDQA
jgi:hypothetical protein